MPSNSGADENPRWIETSATVLSCRYQFSRLNTLTMGVQTGEKFRIIFEYYAHGRLYSGEFESPIAIAQNETVPIKYNPLRPQEHSFSKGEGRLGEHRWLGAGVAASILLSLLCLGIVRGCN